MREVAQQTALLRMIFFREQSHIVAQSKQALEETLGVGLPYALTVAAFGGTAEYVALWLKSAGHETWFYWYVTISIALSLVVYAGMRDTRNQSTMDCG